MNTKLVINEHEKLIDTENAVCLKKMRKILSQTSKLFFCTAIIYHVRQKKTAPFYFCNNFVKTSSITTFLVQMYFNKFPIARVFHILYNQRRGTSLSA